MKPKLSYQSASRMFRYDDATGQLLWAQRRPGVRLMKPAGGAVNGMRYVMVDGERFKVKDIVWLLKTGAWPAGRLYHVDRNKMNCAYENLSRSPAGRRTLAYPGKQFELVQTHAGGWEVSTGGEKIGAFEPGQEGAVLELVNCLVRY